MVKSGGGDGWLAFVLGLSPRGVQLAGALVGEERHGLELLARGNMAQALGASVDLAPARSIFWVCRAALFALFVLALSVRA
jgi:hypothetical protein